MVTVKSAEFFSFILAGSLAYLMTTIFSGVFQAWIAKKLGDNTAEQAGFLSFNPVVYIDLFGFFCFLLAGFGWGTLVPINPHNFKGKHKRLELLVAIGSRPLALCILALISLMIMVFFLGGLTSLYTSAIPQFPTPRFLYSYPELKNALRLVFGLMADFSIFFTFYSLLIAVIRALFFFYLSKQNNLSFMLSMEAELVCFVISFFFLYFFAQHLSFLILFIIRYIEVFLWHGWSSLGTLLGFLSFYA